MEKLPTILIPSTILESRRQGQAHLQQAHLQQALRQTLPPIDLRQKAPKGHAETQFERDLWHYFPGKIHTGLTIQHPDYKQPYIPDFVYIDPHLNLHIDIEIDEPYAYVSREPLHYLNCVRDEIRNQFFLDAGWLVIRFGEAQAVKQSASCCKAIAATIATLTNDNTVMHPFRQVPTLKPELRWTQAEAQQMAEQALREQYNQPYELEQSVKRKRKKPQTIRKASIVSANFTFYCPECGDGPIRWQGHYVQCPNCSYDAFAF